MSFRASAETNDTKFAATMSVPRGRKRRVGQTRPQGRNGYGAWPDRSKKTAPVKKTAELLQQFSGLPRFGKHSLICVPV